MAHEWYAGVLNQSSWHGLESVEAMPDADTMIRRGLETGAWPASVDMREVRTVDGLYVPGQAVVATYADGSVRAHGTVKDRYHPLDPRQWQETVKAACKAGAIPAGAFALNGGARVLATFELPSGNGIKPYLNIVDSMDGELAFQAGGTCVRVVCANTLSMSMGRDSAEWGWAKHTRSLSDRVGLIQGAVEAYIKAGSTVHALYQAAKDTAVHKDDAMAIFDRLFPPAAEDDSKAKATRADNARSSAARAMARPENAEGSSLATIWNAATWLVDRDEVGRAKPVRGGADALGSMLFGSRGDRVQEIEAVIREALVPVIDAQTGETRHITAPEAHAHGVDYGQIGRSLIDDML